MVKGYKLTEVGIIPEDWEVLSYGEIFVFLNTATYSRDQLTENDEIYYVHYGDIHVRCLHFLDLDKITLPTIKKDLLKNYPTLKDGDLIVVDASEDYEGVGKSVEVRNLKNRKVISGLHTFLLRDKEEKIANGFKGYIHSNKLVKKQMDTLATGLKVYGVSKSNLKKILIPLPPTKAEQSAIATVLSDADALIEKLEQLIAKKRLIKQGAMQELLKPKEGWEVKTLHELADNKKELFDDGDWIEAEHITDNGIRIIQTGNIGVGCYVEKENKKYIYEDSFYKLKCKQLIEGDLLICRLAEPAGRACVLPNIGESRIVTSVDVTIFRPRTEVANRVFLANLFSTSDWFTKVIERVGGTTHKRISRSSLGKISISIPKIDVQNQIAEILSDMDNEIKELERQLEKYKMMKQGMMQVLLTGKIRLVKPVQHG